MKFCSVWPSGRLPIKELERGRGNEAARLPGPTYGPAAYGRSFSSRKPYSSCWRELEKRKSEVEGATKGGHVSAQYPLEGTLYTTGQSTAPETTASLDSFHGCAVLLG